jgi:hypothetical protein
MPIDLPVHVCTSLLGQRPWERPFIAGAEELSQAATERTCTRSWTGVDQSSGARTGKSTVALSRPILGVLESSVIASDDALHKDFVAFLSSSEYSASAAMSLLRAAHDRRDEEALRALRLHSVHASCVARLSARAAATASARFARSRHSRARALTNVHCSFASQVARASDADAPVFARARQTAGSDDAIHACRPSRACQSTSRAQRLNCVWHQSRP